MENKVLIGGDFFSINGIPRRRAARLHADGSVDTGFNPGTGANDTVNAIAAQPDGKALLGGFFNTVNGVGRSSAARLERDLLRPVLAIGRVTPIAIVLSWPSAFTNFTLQTTTNVDSGWLAVSIAPALVSSQWFATNLIEATGRYFRLEGP